MYLEPKFFLKFNLTTLNLIVFEKKKQYYLDFIYQCNYLFKFH